MEAEFIAFYEEINHVIWRNFVTWAGCWWNWKAIESYCDHRAATEFSNNNGSFSASKHIDIKYLFVIESVKNHIVSIEQRGTNFMLADPLTKALTPKVFQGHIAQMGVVSLEDVQF